MRSSLIVPAIWLWLASGATAALAVTAPTGRHTLTGQSVAVGIRVIRPELVKASGLEAAWLANAGVDAAEVKLDKLSGKARIISGGTLLAGQTFEAGAALSQTRLVKAAMTFLATVDLGVTADDLRLDPAATLIDKDVQFLKFRVIRDGLAVEDATIDFRFKHGQLVQVANQTFSEAATDTRVALEDNAALGARAAAALATEGAKALGDSFRVALRKGAWELVKVAAFEVKSLTGERFRVQVEAATGDVFEVRPTVFHMDGDALGDVHPRWYNQPVESQPYGELSLADATGAVLTDVGGAFSGAPDTAQPKLDGFVGSRVKIALRSGTKVTRSGTRIRDRWSVVYRKDAAVPAAEDKDMAQAMVFQHTNQIIRYAKGYIATPWLDRELTANVNLTQTCNAHWDGTTINFYSAGGGCANTGLISDVVFHEWGHGLDHNTGGIEDGAYSEGFGDIMSLMLTHSNVLGIGFRLDGSPVRDLGPDKIYPRDAGEVHAEGLIIGTTFYDLYTALVEKHGDAKANDLLSNYALKTVFTASRYTDVYDALLVVDDDNADLSDGTPNYCLVNRAFAAHGLATADAACELAMVDDYVVDDTVGGDADGILEPGETADLWLSARNAAAQTLSGLTGVLSTATNNVITVTAPNIAWNDIGANSRALSRLAARVEVNANAACGASDTAKLALAAGTRSLNVSVPLTVGKMVGVLDSVNVAGLPQPIRDNQSTTALIDIDTAQWAAGTQVARARLKFDISHTWIGDLTIALIAPNGTRKEVLRGSGSGQNINFDADISALLAGVAGRGQWQLVVTDSAAIDEGTLDAVQLDLTPALYECN